MKKLTSATTSKNQPKQRAFILKKPTVNLITGRWWLPHTIWVLPACANNSTIKVLIRTTTCI